MDQTRWKAPRPEHFESHVLAHRPWPSEPSASDHLWNYKSVTTTQIAHHPYLNAPPLLPPLGHDIPAPFWLSPRQLSADPRFVTTARIHFQGPKTFLLNSGTDKLPENQEVSLRRQNPVIFDIRHSPSIYQEDFCSSH